VFLDNIPHIRRTPVIPTWPEIEDLAEEILTRAFYENGYTIDDAIRDLEDATAPLFEEASGP
jgi:multiple sugar transport system substrate-binding protein